MKVVSLFSGIEGIGLGLERAGGFKIVRQVEIDRFCLRVLNRHWPDVPKGDDVRKEVPEDYERLYGAINVVCGGFPCQDLSVAGKRAGLAGERSGLFFELLRIADSMPTAWVLAENVPGLLSSSKGRDFATVLGELSGFFPEVPDDGWRNSGVCYGSKGCVAWRVLDAQYFGVAQRRRRVFIVRSPATSRGGAFEVLFESDCLPGDTAPSREAREAITAVFATSPDGSGRETDTSPTLDARAKDGPRRNQGGVIVAILGHTKSNGLGIFEQDTSNTLEAIGSANQAVFCWESLRRENDCYRECGDLAPTLQGFMGTGGNNVPMVGVRRLTPTECERLQGFPDGWTVLDNKTPDSPRYRSLGNAVCVNVAEWIGKRIMEIHKS